MMSARPVLAFLTPFAIAAVAVAEEAARPVPPGDDFAPGLLLGVLLVAAAVLVLLGVGIVVGLACVGCAGACVALGIVSTSALVAVLRGRLSAGLRAMHYQLSAAIGLPCGIVALWLGTLLAGSPLGARDILLIGSAAGIVAGLAMAFLLDRLARLVYRRLVTTSASSASA